MKGRLNICLCTFYLLANLHIPYLVLKYITVIKYLYEIYGILKHTHQSKYLYLNGHVSLCL